MKHLLSILVLNVAFFSAVIKGFSQNLALNKPVKVSSVETGTSYSGNLAVDGNYKSRWSSDHSDPQWIYVDLGGQYNITSVKITWENAYGKNYNIDISNDATNWTTIKSITDNSSLTNNNSVSGTARYVRIYGTQRGTIYGYSIYELEIYGSSGSTQSSGSSGSSTNNTNSLTTNLQNLALNKPVKVSSVETGTSYSGNLAVDGNYKSRWSSDHSDPQWIYVDLGGQYNITSVKITWENAYGKNYNIDISNDATNWTTIKSITDNSSLTNNNSVSGTARYVRIYGTQRGTIYGYSIYELEIYGSSGSTQSSGGSGTSGSGSGGSSSGSTNGGSNGGTSDVTSGSGGLTTTTGKTYYFSSTSGDDSRSSTQAQNPSTPWKTLAKLNSFFSSLQPGDLVVFKRGDIFPGNINITKSGSSGYPISFSAYGSGPRPVITGFSTVTSWLSTGNGLYTATVSAGLSTLNMVTRNGAFQAMGKYPKGNSGYFTVNSVNGASSISSSGISGIPNFVGGEVVWRAKHWVLWRGTVTAQSSNTVSFTAFPSTLGGSVEAAQANYGFFFQNSPNACTSMGEWAYNSSSHKITMYFGSAGPGNSIVQVSSIENLVTLTNRSYITFDNIALTGANSESFTLTNSNNTVINSCDILFSGHDAVSTNNGCSNIKVTNCNISYSNFNAIWGGGSSAWTISGNTISNTGSVAGMGGSGEGQYGGILNVSNGSTITYNKITNTGYNPLSFQGTNNTIQYNFIDTFCTVKDDGGGIYCGGQNYSGTKITYNIVLHGIGALAGTPDKDGRTHGIYVDDGGSNVEIGYNTAAYCQYSGIYTHNGHDLNIHDNTVFDNNTTGIKYYNDGNTIKNITLTNNVFFAKTSSELVSYSSGGTASPTQFFSTANNNYWCRPMNESNDFEILIPSVSLFNLSGWKSFIGKETNSHISPVAVTNVNNIRFEYNATSSNKVVNLGSNYIDAKGVSHAGSITLSAYSSAVLILSSGTSTRATANTVEIDNANPLKQSFAINPNPVIENFTIDLNNNYTGKMHVLIINESGTIIRSLNLNKDQESTQLSLSARNFPPGAYFVRVQIGNWIDTKKILKL